MTAAFNLALLANNLNTSGQLDATDGLVGILPRSNGGTGLNTASPSNGQLLIGNGSGYTLATLTAGSNITITNASGSITITANATAPVYSPQFAFPAVNVQLTWNHGLGSRPRRFGAVAVITDGSFGSPVGTAIMIASSDGDAARQTSVFANTTVVGFIGATPVYRMLDGQNLGLTGANSNIYFWAEK